MPSIVWKGHLTFGLVSIPVKLYRAARRERVRMNYVHREEREEQASTLPFANPGGFAPGAAEQLDFALIAKPEETVMEMGLDVGAADLAKGVNR